MDTPHPDMEHPEAAGGIVYIREVPVTALPDAIRAQLGGVAQVWGLHTPEGACVALARDRAMAFVLARQNDLTPVSAH
jgi:hypothetical protein